MATIGEGLLSLGRGLSQGIIGRRRRKELERIAEELYGPEATGFEPYGEGWTGAPTRDVMQAKESYNEERRKGIGALAGMPGVLQQAMMQKHVPKTGTPQIVQMPRGEIGEVTPGSGQGITQLRPPDEEKPEYRTAGSENVIRVNPDGSHEFIPIPRNRDPMVDTEDAYDAEASMKSGMPMYRRYDVVTNIGDDGKVTIERTPTEFFSKVSASTQIQTDVPPWMQDKLYARRQKEELDRLNESQMRMENIAASYKREYLSIPGKIGFAIKKVGDFFNVLSPKGEKKLGEAAIFYMDSQTNFNQYVKDTTGAQMSELEVPRYQKAMPNNDDSPAIFWAKLQRGMEVTRLAAAKKREVLDSMRGVPYDIAIEAAERAAVSVMKSGLAQIAEEIEGHEGFGILEE